MGLPLFLAAIMINMIVGEVMYQEQKTANLEETSCYGNDVESLAPALFDTGSNPIQLDTPRNTVVHRILICVLVTMLVPTVLALYTDYLKITMIFFKGNSFSIWTAITAIYHMDLWGFGTLMMIYLVVMPIAWTVCLFIL